MDTVIGILLIPDEPSKLVTICFDTLCNKPTTEYNDIYNTYILFSYNKSPFLCGLYDYMENFMAVYWLKLQVFHIQIKGFNFFYLNLT